MQIAWKGLAWRQNHGSVRSRNIAAAALNHFRIVAEQLEKHRITADPARRLRFLQPEQATARDELALVEHLTEIWEFSGYQGPDRIAYEAGFRVMLEQRVVAAQAVGKNDLAWEAMRGHGREKLLPIKYRAERALSIFLPGKVPGLVVDVAKRVGRTIRGQNIKAKGSIPAAVRNAL